jgi:hypothetical protein
MQLTSQGNNISTGEKNDQAGRYGLMKSVFNSGSGTKES